MLKQLRRGLKPKAPAKIRGAQALTASEKAKEALAAKFPNIEETVGLAKWLDRGLDSEKHNFLAQLDFTQINDPKVKALLFLIGEVFLNLPADTKSGNLMQFLCNVMNAKLKFEDKKKQESIDVALGHLNLDLNFMKAIRDWLQPNRIEIHQSFHEISNEKKLLVNKAIKFATQLFSEFKASN